MPKVVPHYKQEAKTRILNAAIEVFAEKGYNRTTMDDVASEIGVSKGALYLYFKSKEKLFEEMSRTAIRVFEEDLFSTFASKDVRKSAETYFDKEMGLGNTRGTLWLQTLAEAGSNRAVKKVLEDGYAGALEVLARFVDDLKKRGGIRRELDSMSVARIFAALHDGVVVSMLQGTSESIAKKMWIDGFGFLTSGMGP